MKPSIYSKIAGNWGTEIVTLNNSKEVYLAYLFLFCKLKNLTVGDLKVYLNAHNLPVSGKKEALISRILTHMGK